METHKCSLVSIIWIGLLMAFLTGCTSSRVGGELLPNDRDFPELNASPERRVVIHGSLPSAFDAKFIAYYRASEYSGCRYSPTFLAGAVEGVSFPIGTSLPLKVVREGERYSVDLIVDHFKLGRCGWKFSGVSAEISKSGVVSLANTIVLNKELQSSKSEEWGFNSQDVAVVWRCKFDGLTDRPKEQRIFACGGFAQKYRDKGQHLLNSVSKTVEVDFIDMDTQ